MLNGIIMSDINCLTVYRKHVNHFLLVEFWMYCSVPVMYIQDVAVRCDMLICCDVQCEKIRKQKGKFLGSFRVAHTTSLDETDNKIMSVRYRILSVSVSLCFSVHSAVSILPCVSRSVCICLICCVRYMQTSAISTLLQQNGWISCSVLLSALTITMIVWNGTKHGSM